MDDNKRLIVKWQRLVSDGQTCPRCASTEKEIEKAVSKLKESLEPLGVEVILEKDEISSEEFRREPLESNRIWVNGQPLEDLVGGEVGQSPCCDICGPSECRTLAIGNEIYETIPAELVVRAGLIAASRLVGQEPNKSCCVGYCEAPPSAGCCPK